jgi:hypothetical protein
MYQLLMIGVINRFVPAISHRETEHPVRVVAPRVVFGRSRVQMFLSRRPTALSEDFRGVSQFLQTSAGVGSTIPNYGTISSFQLDTVYPELQTASPNFVRCGMAKSGPLPTFCFRSEVHSFTTSGQSFVVTCRLSSKSHEASSPDHQAGSTDCACVACTTGLSASQ